MTFRVIVEEQAAWDIAAYGEWIASQGSPLNAVRWVDGIEEAIDSLAWMPTRCAIAPESEYFEEEIRQLVFGSHRILFVVDEAAVHVLHVRHGARLPLAGDEHDDEPTE